MPLRQTAWQENQNGTPSHNIPETGKHPGVLKVQTAKTELFV